MQKWLIYLEGSKLDEVYYEEDCTRQYVYDTLTKIEGFPETIIVLKSDWEKKW